MNSCLNCKHAKWALTTNGRVNPHKIGECMWRKVVYVPKSYAPAPVTLTGRYISRKTPHEKCPVFQERV